MSFIETQRLLMRTWMPGDLDEALAMYGDPEVTRYVPSGVQTRETLPALLDRLMAVSERGQIGYWPVIEKSTGAIVGQCGLAKQPGDADVEIGWMLRRSAWGNGYATEAAQAVLAYALDRLKLERIVAYVEPGNTPSIAVLHRIGMVFDRMLRRNHRDQMRYTLAGARP